MEYIINTKEKKVATLERYISVPKLFLALPFFTPKNSAATEKYIEVAKFSDLKNIKLRSVNLSVIRDFEVFLFLMKKAYQKKSNTFEFDNLEIFKLLKIKPNHRDSFIKDVYISLIEEKLSSIDVSYTKKEDALNKRFGFKFIEYRAVDKKTTKIRLSKEFIEFFNELEYLYDIPLDILDLLSNEYQRILYILYVCNRKNATNFFTVEDLKKRFSVSSKTPDKTFVMNIRKANNSLFELGLITKFEEEKEDGKKNGKTVTFKVDYTYKTLYTDLKKKRAVAALNLDAFKKPVKVSVKKEEQETQTTTNYEDQEWI
ncbi:MULTISPECIES: RepB family plasmid replication initiator protein [Pseudomonas]|uniref:RepB family plasmid replication initiator protein n=1 Tax=Pseudomonas TaxID=286 RepID=UPI0012988352|nr:RepB family plasmid replication initiator protein [Pseudomonas aeruginosa]